MTPIAASPLDILIEYNWAHDLEDIDMLLACYAPEGEAVFKLPGGRQVGPVAGAENLRRMYETVVHGMEGKVRRHFVTNTIMERETRDEAVVRSYVLITEAAPASVALYAAGWQRDVLVRTEAGWRIRSKELTLDGIGAVPAQLGGELRI